ncbi:MAG: hypothetical protein LC737_07865 [Chloroflexi bacterium]|nr:hypothetical protein [Chloroflexota bacterium]
MNLLRRIVAHPNSRTGLLLACALISAALYLAFITLPYPLLEHFADIRTDLGKLSDHSHDSALQFFACVALLFVLYVGAYRVARTTKLSPNAARLIVAAPLLFALIGLWGATVGSNDVFDYSVQARMLTRYGMNPMLHPPYEGGDPWLDRIGWQDAPTPYGPLWVGIASVNVLFAGDELLYAVLGFKLIAIASLIADAVLVYLIVRRLKPREALGAYLLVGWNPLMVFETAVNGHNDALMMTFVLLALLFYQRHRAAFAVAFVVLAALIKFPAIAVLPFLVLAELRAHRSWMDRVKWLVHAGTMAVTTAALAHAPLWEGDASLSHILPRQNLWFSSLGLVCLNWLRPIIGEASAIDLTHALGYGLCAGALIVILFRTRDQFTSLARSAMSAFVLLVLLVSFWFQPWYVLWLIPLAPLVRRDMRVFTVLFSASVFTNYWLYDFGLAWNPEFFDPSDGTVLAITAVALILVPPLLFIVGCMLRELEARAWQRPTERAVSFSNELAMS